MKKKFISICITLILFFTSVVPVFAIDTVADTQVPYWLLDIRHQCYLSNNAADVTFGLATYGQDSSIYLVEIVKGGALYLTYEVPAGETVYFRWAIARNNMGNTGASTYVRMSVDGSQKVNHTYNYSNLGEYGTYGSIVIVEDYTNTSNSTQLVTYVIENDGVGNPTYEYVPILVGTNALINQGSTNFSDFDFTVDLSGVEDKLDDIIELLQQREEDIDFEVPFDLWQIYSFFIEHYSYFYSNSDDKIPWLIRNGSQEGEFTDELAFRGFNSTEVYFSFITDSKDVEVPRLIRRNGAVVLGESYYVGLRSISYGSIYTFKFTVDPTEYYTLYLRDQPFYNKIIPLYIGNGNDVPESIERYVGLPSQRTNLLDTIKSTLNSIRDKLDSTGSAEVENSKDVNSQLYSSVDTFDNIEKEQVNNFTQNISNLPSFDFGSISDFSTTANFVSTQMQNIYNSSDYIRFIYTAILTFGIALVLIGRGLKR